jgi:multicomponent Na+:H+ antiporter subunit E
MGDIILRLVIWFLLTANFSVANVLIGITISLLLPRISKSQTSLKEILWGLIRIIVAIPQAYKEAFELIFQPHNEEEIVMEPVKGRRSPGLIFLDIFLITFTPKTTVLKYYEEGWYAVHYVKRRKGS